MTRWGHAHTFAGGFLACAIMLANGWLLLVGALIVFMAGLSAHRLGGLVRGAFTFLRGARS